MYLLLAFVAWFSLTTLFAMNPEAGVPMLQRALKVQLMVFMMLALFHTKRQLDLLIWVIVLSIGFYGVKGGIFTLRTGAAIGRVYGPFGSFIEDNNAVGLALVITIPYGYYLFTEVKNRWGKAALLLAAGLCAIAALGTYSRGAFLAILAMSTLLWWKSRHKLMLGFAAVMAVPLLIGFLPDKWQDRMRGIADYEQDTSAVGRLNAWQTAINLAKDHPIVGGGFEFHTPEVFARYAPVPEDMHSMHSIYFQVLGEHGYVGLALFVAIWIFTWITSARLISATRDRADLHWAANLVSMVQVSLVGYLVGGAFLDLSYWDLPYYSLAILIVTRDIVRRSMSPARQTSSPVGPPLAIGPVGKSAAVSKAARRTA